MQPQRIQRKRTKGWKMPEGAVYVGRPSKWGNPYQVYKAVNGLWVVRNYMILGAFSRKSFAVEAAVMEFRNLITDCLESNRNYLDELRGKDLACWCSLSDKCHADVLLELANK